MPFTAGDFLGPWLRAVWHAHPVLQPDVLRLAEDHAGLAAWRARLCAVCAILRWPALCQEDQLPVAGGQNVVFFVHGHYVKFFSDQVGRACEYLVDALRAMCSAPCDAAPAST